MDIDGYKYPIMNTTGGEIVCPSSGISIKL